MKCPTCQTELNENGVCPNCSTSNQVINETSTTEQNQSTTVVEDNTETQKEITSVEQSNIEVQEPQKRKSPVLIIIMILLILALLSSLVIFKPWTLLEAKDRDQLTNNGENNKEPVLNGNKTPSDDMVEEIVTPSDDIVTPSDDVIVQATPSDDEIAPEQQQQPEQEKPKEESNSNEENKQPVEEPKDENPEDDNKEEEKPKEQEPTEEPKEETPTEQPVEELNELEKTVFLNFVREAINSSQSVFMQNALSSSAGRGQFFTNLDVETIYPKSTIEVREGDKYYIEYDRNMNINRMLFFNNTACYDSGTVNSLDKYDIEIDDIVRHNENDSINGCVNKK